MKYVFLVSNTIFETIDSYITSLILPGGTRVIKLSIIVLILSLISIAVSPFNEIFMFISLKEGITAILLISIIFLFDLLAKHGVKGVLSSIKSIPKRYSEYVEEGGDEDERR